MESELLRLSYDLFEQSKGITHIYCGRKARKFLNKLDKYPHAFVLGALMDNGIIKDEGWAIPYKVYKELGNFSIDFLADISIFKYLALFEDNDYHRFNFMFGNYFYEAIIKIKEDYDGDASNIWSNNPSNVDVINRFLEFNGMNSERAIRATNILARDFKIPMSDYRAIDIYPHPYVRIVMSKLGYISKKNSKQQSIEKAREINPEYPGLIDRTLWKIGREYCHSNNPECDSCPLKNECEYNLNINNG